MAPTTKPNQKPIFKTSSPFTETNWPQISRDDQEVILDLIYNLITPLGDHRRTHVHPSKGKKRKRNAKPGQDDFTMTDTPPPPPEIGKHILVGLNSVTRHLEALAKRNAPPTAPVAISKSDKKKADSKDEKKPDLRDERPPDPDVKKEDEQTHTEPPRPLSILILTHPKPSHSPAHAHLPTLVHLFTLSSTPPRNPTRLISLPTSIDYLLAKKLHIPRVGALAIFEGAPGAKTLEEYVREHVGVTECMWIDQAMKAEWRGVNVKAEGSGEK